MWYVCDVLYAVLYVRVSCFVVRGCAVSMRYINVCNCDMFSIVNVYLNHLKFVFDSVYVDNMPWCGWCMWGVGRGMDQGLEGCGGVMPV